MGLNPTVYFPDRSRIYEYIVLIHAANRLWGETTDEDIFISENNLCNYSFIHEV